MTPESKSESIAAGNAAAPGEAPRQIVHRPGGQDVEFVTFPPGDREDPRNWPLWRKWSIVLTIMLVDLSDSFIASGFSPASTKFSKDFGVSAEVATLGLSLTVLGFAFGPMTLAPLSEYFGRSPIYIVSYGINLLFLLGAAIVSNLAGFLVLRFLSGWFAAVTIANFGGTIADLFEPHATGIPMSIFLWAATVGSPLGYFLFSFIAQSRPWRHIFWALLGICGGFWLMLIGVLRETRHSILLLRRAAKERKETGNENLEVPEAMKQRGPKELFKVALLRPFRFLFTEAIIVFAALYNGYLYGLSFLFNDAFSLVFGPEGHGFEVSGVGLAFLGICVGVTSAVFTNLWQERYYHRRIAEAGGKNVPEARVEIGKVAAITLPVSLFWFAWTSYKSVHWIVPILASVLWGWSFYTLILMTYTYTEDSYKVFSASALAGIGLVRNLAGAGFPLFGRQMFVNEGYQWAGSILGFLAILLIPIPFVLSRCGRSLRLRSPWAREHMDDLTENENPSEIKWWQRCAAKAVLVAGTSPSDIPKDMWENYIEAPKRTEPKISGGKRGKYKEEWCTPEVRRALCHNLTLLQRYYLWKADLLNVPTVVTKQVTEAFRVKKLLQVHYHIVGQRPAAQEVIDNITSHLLSEDPGPLVMLFTGASGHGKTELASRMGELLSLKMLKVDCAKNRHATDMFGAEKPFSGWWAGSDLNNFLAEHDGCMSVVFLDEFDKTSKEVRDAMLVPLDWGVYQDRRTQRSVDCTKTIWIMVTNHGKVQIRRFWDEHLEHMPEENHMDAPWSILQTQLEKACIAEFEAPLTGRISAITPFLPFTPNEQAVVTYTFMREMRNAVRKDIDISSRKFARHLHINFVDDGQIAKHLASLGYNPDLGARNLRKIVRNRIRHKVSSEFLKGQEQIKDEMNNKALVKYDVRVVDGREGPVGIEVKKAGSTKIQI